jgi:6-phosphogluconolactonase
MRWILLLLFSAMYSSYAQRIAVGSYASAQKPGIFLVDLDETTGRLKSVASAKGIQNPSFLIQKQDVLYAVSEKSPEGDVVAWTIKKKKLVRQATVSSGGDSPCHLALDQTGQWLFVGNYGGGNWSVLPINSTGEIQTALQTWQHTGRGPDQDRQQKSHVHSISVSPTNQDVFVADLGTDSLKHYTLDPATGQTHPGSGSVALTPGSGPRHTRFHPSGKWLYVVQELTSHVSVYQYSSGKLTFLQEITSIPSGYTGRHASADLHFSPDGQFLYVSNRFYDTLCLFKVDKETGKLKSLAQIPVIGKTPRNFAISPSGRTVLVANQDSDSIDIFQRDLETGLLTFQNSFRSITKPVCLTFLTP